MFKFDRKQAVDYALVALAYLAISCVFFWPVIANITSVLPGTGGDVYQSVWELWWVPFSLFTLHSSPYVTSYIYQPVVANLATQTMAPIAGLVSAIFQPIGTAFSFNVIFLLGFVLSGLFTYLLAFHLTKNRMAAFLAGFIFAFSPIHTIQSFGHLQFTNIEFIPLFLLFFIKMVEDRKPSDAIFAGLSFVLLAFMGDIEQALMTAMVVFFMLVYLLLTKHNRSKILNLKFLIAFGGMIGIVLLAGSPFIIGIVMAFNSSTLSTVNAQATTAYNVLYSPDLLSFFIPSSMNGLLAFAAAPLASINAPAPAERTVYAGYTVLALAIIGLVYSFKDKFKETGILALPLVFFLLLSIGPYLQVGGTLPTYNYTTGTGGIPGLYLAYHQIPFFNVLREPGRFDIVIELLLGLLAAFGLAKVEHLLTKEKHAQPSLNPNLKYYVFAVFLALVVIEYNSLPFSQGAIGASYSSASVSKAYYEIAQLSGNYSVLVLPALQNFSGKLPQLYPGKALYYQTVFEKPLVGGYATRSNDTQVFSMMDLPLAVSASYLESGQGLVYASPIVENYTDASLLLLGAYNVAFVTVEKQAYNQSQLELVVSYLASMFGRPVYIDNATEVFSTYNATRAAGKKVTAYTPVYMGSQYSLWQPGWILCGSHQCNDTVSRTWFSVNPAYITLYAPNYTKVSMNMQAVSPVGQKSVYVFFNRNQPRVLNLTQSVQNITLNFTASPGLNQIIFYSKSGNSTTYSNIGVVNITFKTYS
ncbi:Uncharacterised protein [uncultured archaeon]|nr:Uncharacterised protein [uncultured archaeon]